MNDKPILENLYEKDIREGLIVVESSNQKSSIESLVEIFYQYLSKTMCQPNRFGSSWMRSINESRTKLYKLVNSNKNMYKYANEIIYTRALSGIEKGIKEIKKSNEYDAEIALLKLKKFEFPDYVLNIDFIFDNSSIISYISKNIVGDIYADKLIEYFKKYLKEV